jgi:hypothetical protein
MHVDTALTPGLSVHCPIFSVAHPAQMGVWSDGCPGVAALPREPPCCSSACTKAAVGER